MTTPKELKKLAKACRDAGIKHFKNANVEFTLTDEDPYPKKNSSSPLPLPQTPTLLTPPELTDEQLLLWSVGELPEESTEQ